MRLGSFVKGEEHLVQAVSRETIEAGQRLQPAGDFIQRLEGVVLRQLGDHLAQFARIGQWMLVFLGQNAPQACNLLEHGVSLSLIDGELE